jgi:hypothetical protein
VNRTNPGSFDDLTHRAAVLRTLCESTRVEARRVVNRAVAAYEATAAVLAEHRVWLENFKATRGRYRFPTD